MAEAILTKKDARRAFGWVPPSKRGEQGLISKLKEQGIETKEQIKSYMRTVGMPSNNMAGIKLNAQKQKSRQVNANLNAVKEAPRKKQETATNKQKTIKNDHSHIKNLNKQEQKKLVKDMMQSPVKPAKQNSQNIQAASFEQSMKLSMKLSKMG